MKKIMLITGVSRVKGIGFGIAEAAVQAGFEVIISARSEGVATELASQLSTPNNQVVAVSLDITDDASVKRLARWMEGRYNRLDVLINNAGAGFDMGVQPLETDLEETRKTLEVNLFGAWRLIQQLHPLLRAASQARIVNVSSGAGSFGDPQFGLGVHQGYVTSYGISKLALNGLSIKLARQFTEAGDSIKINSICPGFVATYPGTEAYGARPVSEAVPGILWAATLPDDGPTGGFFRDQRPLSW
ncbi:MAG: SDR family NAD(P)-dependent oxidoreductase [Bacteroidota bacterium]